MSFDVLKTSILALLVPAFQMQPAIGQQEGVSTEQGDYVGLVQQAYGLDQTLVNGFQYHDYYSGFKGIPYFLSLGFTAGEVTIQGNIYRDVKIRYNIYSQRVELEYSSPHLGYNWLVSVSDHIEGFKFMGYSFERLKLEGFSPKFYQVIRTSRFTCYIHWEKRLMPLQNDRIYTNEFSGAGSTCLLEMDDRIEPIRNSKAFAGHFEERYQKEIRRLLKRNRFSVRIASPGEWVMNMNEVANLFNEEILP